MKSCHFNTCAVFVSVCSFSKLDIVSLICIYYQTGWYIFIYNTIYPYMTYLNHPIRESVTSWPDLNWPQNRRGNVPYDTFIFLIKLPVVLGSGPLEFHLTEFMTTLVLLRLVYNVIDIQIWVNQLQHHINKTSRHSHDSQIYFLDELYLPVTTL